jgi:dihydropteroate synthase
MRILSLSGEKGLKELMREIKVDPYGIKIMLPKAQSYLLKINSLSGIASNILKQELLSLGGDAALARDLLTGKVKKADCLVMANLSQLLRLSEKLKIQPFGLAKLAEELKSTLSNYQKDSFQLKAGKYTLNLGSRTHIMGIVNITPDSFSGDGLAGLSLDKAVEYASFLVRDGADIIDIGGESSRPGAKSVSLKEEIARVIPLIKTLARKINKPLSIDTYKPEVAKIALDNGASIVNDITGLKNPKMAKIAAHYKAAVIIMHMQGNPRTMQKNPVYGSLIDDIGEYLNAAILKAQKSGVGEQSIIIDPGIGFGKTLSHNLEILKRLKEFKSLGMPILIGASRKAFIGKILNESEPGKRLAGTIAASISASLNGANILRVHDVKAVKEALKVTDRIKL